MTSESNTADNTRLDISCIVRSFMHIFHVHLSYRLLITPRCQSSEYMCITWKPKKREYNKRWSFSLVVFICFNQSPITSTPAALRARSRDRALVKVSIYHHWRQGKLMEANRFLKRLAEKLAIKQKFLLDIRESKDKDFKAYFDHKIDLEWFGAGQNKFSRVKPGKIYFSPRKANIGSFRSGSLIIMFATPTYHAKAMAKKTCIQGTRSRSKNFYF